MKMKLNNKINISKVDICKREKKTGRIEKYDQWDKRDQREKISIERD